MTPFNLALFYIEIIKQHELTFKQKSILAKRHLRPAKEIVEFFENEPDMPCKIIEMANKHFLEMDRSWTLETVLKNLPVIMSKVYKEDDKPKKDFVTPYDKEGRLKIDNIVAKITKEVL